MRVLGFDFDTPAPELEQQEQAILYGVIQAIRMFKGSCTVGDLRQWGAFMEEELGDVVNGPGPMPLTAWQSLVWTAGYNAASQS